MYKAANGLPAAVSELTAKVRRYHFVLSKGTTMQTEKARVVQEGLTKLMAQAHDLFLRGKWEPVPAVSGRPGGLMLKLKGVNKAWVNRLGPTNWQAEVELDGLRYGVKVLSGDPSLTFDSPEDAKEAAWCIFAGRFLLDGAFGPASQEEP